MDPNANLREQIRLAVHMQDSDDIDPIDVHRLAELVLALDEWICKGGFLPTSWHKNSDTP